MLHPPTSETPAASTTPHTQLYLAAGGSPASNIQLLQHMVGTRAEMAQLAGYASYAHLRAAGARWGLHAQRRACAHEGCVNVWGVGSVGCGG